MTKLTYVYPCLAGVLKISIVALCRSLQLEDEVKSVCWLSFFISAGFLGLCLFYFCFLLAFSLIKYHEWIGLPFHFHSFFNDAKKHPYVLIALINGVLGAIEMIILMMLATLSPTPSLALLIIGLSQGQFVTSIILDLSGLCWIPIFRPWETTAVGGGFVFLGTLILLMYPMESSWKNSWIFGRYFAAFGCGIISFLSYAFTRRLSYSFVSYWAGTSVAALGQVITLLCVSFSLDSKTNTLHHATNLVHSFSDFALFFCAVVSLVVGSAAIQFYGDSGGFFSTMGPLIAGQVVLSSCLEMAGDWPSTKFGGDLQKCSGSTITALIMLILGSWLMWRGRWTKPKPKREPQYTVRHQTVVLVRHVSLERGQGELEEEEEEEAPEVDEKASTIPLSSTENILRPERRRISFLVHPAAPQRYCRSSDASRQVSAASSPRSNPNCSHTEQSLSREKHDHLTSSQLHVPELSWRPPTKGQLSSPSSPKKWGIFKSLSPRRELSVNREPMEERNKSVTQKICLPDSTTPSDIHTSTEKNHLEIDQVTNKLQIASHECESVSLSRTEDILSRECEINSKFHSLHSVHSFSDLFPQR